MNLETRINRLRLAVWGIVLVLLVAVAGICFAIWRLQQQIDTLMRLLL